MAPINPINAAGIQSAFDALDAEIAAAAALQRDAVFAQFLSSGLPGTNLAYAWTLGSLDSIRFRLIYLRVHFLDGSNANPLIISIDSAEGIAHDTTLATIAVAGNGNDVNYIVAQEESKNPSPWTFGVGDAIRIDWASADPLTSWAVEIGLAPAL